MKRRVNYMVSWKEKGRTHSQNFHFETERTALPTTKQMLVRVKRLHPGKLLGAWCFAHALPRDKRKGRP